MYVHNNQPNRTKLDPKALKCIFIGYAPSQKGYKCYNPLKRQVLVSTDVTFYEDQSFYPSPVSVAASPSLPDPTPISFPSLDARLPLCSQGGEFLAFKF